MLCPVPTSGDVEVLNGGTFKAGVNFNINQRKNDSLVVLECKCKTIYRLVWHGDHFTYDNGWQEPTDTPKESQLPSEIFAQQREIQRRPA